MRIPALAILAIGVVSAAAPARAQTYDPGVPVCMHVVGLGISYEDCSYFTMDQCKASAAGRAAQCNVNPYYVGAKVSPARPVRRHRSAY
jgi:hypothetical protein